MDVRYSPSSGYPPRQFCKPTRSIQAWRGHPLLSPVQRIIVLSSARLSIQVPLSTSVPIILAKKRSLHLFASTFPVRQHTSQHSG
ncbi:hypothetical protein N3K66_001775 [Trichothecium roseum]|uniref:Uncharacterized protein n=1 Tax=Trichothecium roseum TaxID=47278 RepID=A0ACC0VAD7_9HYPO|nr:hypothetical protein N3K66_001775 [Trichothecium roseum]